MTRLYRKIDTVLIALLLVTTITISCSKVYNKYAVTTDRHVGSGQTYKTISAALAAANGGDTILIHDGTYTDEISSVPNGTSSAYTIIKAVNDGGVTITSVLSLTSGSYVQFEGLKWQITAQKRAAKGSSAHHIKYLRCAFQGGGTTGNETNTAIGNGAHHILFEDCWFYGLGGRYQLLIYYADYVIVRRCTFRVDGGWSEGGQANPQAATIAYSSNNVAYQNCILIDSPSSNYSSSQDRNGFYQTCDMSVSNISYEGCIAVNGSYAAFNMDPKSRNGISNLTFKDILVLAYDHGIVSKISATVLRATISATPGKQLGSWQGTLFVSYSLLNSASLDLRHAVSLSFSNTWTSSVPGTQNRNINPLTNGLLYPVRVESDSYLALNQTGGQMGAKITTKIGDSGTLYDDTGWNSDTGVSLWPWPYEGRIKTDMAAVSTRGFCASTANPRTNTGYITLTSYIWEYLGNTEATTALYSVAQYITP
jgi:hypothetical protein